MKEIIYLKIVTEENNPEKNNLKIVTEENSNRRELHKKKLNMQEINTSHMLTYSLSHTNACRTFDS